SLSTSNIKSLMSAFRDVKLMPPPVDCLSPLGPEFIKKGLRNVYENQHPSFYSRPVLRPPSVYNGNPFQIEAGIVYGGDIPADEQVKIIRFVNKVPRPFPAGRLCDHQNGIRTGLETVRPRPETGIWNPVRSHDHHGSRLRNEDSVYCRIKGAIAGVDIISSE
ncbi:DNA topoisomerase VI, subunit B, transducer domain protein, partial [mine drainage metagenome]